MALKFAQLEGKAKKSSINQFQYQDGDNIVRMVGDILPRYVYWIKGENDKNIPMECLSFNRSTETFDNKEKDWVRQYNPDMKCGWSYAIQCIDPKDGQVKVLNLKKKLLEQIMLAAEDLGDPTNAETGWDIAFKRVKTGPMAFNVEYQLQVLRCKTRALEEAELEAIAELKSMDEVLPRPSADAQKELLDRVRAGGNDAPAAEVAKEFSEGSEQKW
jgi:hypothetical protein|tara:strand:- start:1326 stop:1973 length:648 start_codon:yes stop_codon:yes gene_type:complete